MNNQQLEETIANYLDDRTNKEELNNAFYALAASVFDYFTTTLKDLDREEAINSAVELCWLKLPRYDRTKGKAFNFFTTITLCFLRQMYRAKTSYVKLKHRYCAEKELQYI